MSYGLFEYRVVKRDNKYIGYLRIAGCTKSVFTTFKMRSRKAARELLEKVAEDNGI